MSRRTQSSQAKRSQPTIEEAFQDINLNVDEQVNDLVRYMVNRAAEHAIFKRSEFKRNVLPKAGPNFQPIVETATRILKDVYGYNVIVVDAAQNFTKAFIVSSGLSYVKDPTEEVGEPCEGDYPKDAHKILILLILSHILMANNPVSEASLYAFLKSLTIDVERRHELFGNVKDVINTLKTRKYLEMETDPLSQKVSFSWGPRAEKEISKKKFYNLYMYNDRQPASWVNQFKIANQQQFENHKEALPLNNEQEVDED